MAKLLLVGICKPYGVDDEYSEALCTMELLNNQVTREQGIHSPRSNNPSFALYMLAENIEVETTVLDFPNWKAFTKEINSGSYTHVGISFIVPNVYKVKRMAEYIRQKTPDTKIILGGHGAGTPDLKDIVDCDEICLGEGISWLRRYFCEDLSKPIKHPVVRSATTKYVYGAPIRDEGATIIPGVGCQNSCRFCATSHKFEKQYTPFLRHGKDIFDACVAAEKKFGVDDYVIMDENFCKSPVRARQLLTEMEKHDKAYAFSIFSSADAVTKLGVDFLVRLGVNFIWIGVESKWNIFEKTHNIDLHSLIRDLQDHGTGVLASTILFLEHHDKEKILEDIDWAIGLESNLLQFMQFGPIPGTQLYKDYEAEGKLMMDIPWHKQHGQDEIWFHHPHFTLPETSQYLKDAFIKKYETHGPGILNMAHTAVKGWINLKNVTREREEKGLVWDPETLSYEKHLSPKPDEFMKLRIQSWEDDALKFRPILSSARKYAPNKKAAEKADMVIELYNEVFGKPTLKDRAMEAAVKIFAVIENLRYKKNGVVMRQPGTNKVEYPDRSRPGRFAPDSHIRSKHEKPKGTERKSAVTIGR